MSGEEPQAIMARLLERTEATNKAVVLLTEDNKEEHQAIISAAKEANGRMAAVATDYYRFKNMAVGFGACLSLLVGGGGVVYLIAEIL